MDKISAVVITLNEERNIGRCLASLAGVADEVVVVDSGSTDRTQAICAEQGAHFFQESWRGYAETKNLALSRAGHGYVLSIDADEALSPLLRESLLAAKRAGLSGCYSMSRLTNYCGRWIRHGGWYPDRKVRLFDRRRGRWTGELVHEELDLDAGQKETVLAGDLLHYSYYSSLEHRLRADKYSRLMALKLHRRGKRSYPGRPLLSALGRFLGMYLLKGGFLDGAAGLSIAWISAQSNLVKYRELARLDREADDAGA